MAERWSKTLELNTVNGHAVTAELSTGGGPNGGPYVEHGRVHFTLEDAESTAFASLTANMARDLAHELNQAADKAEARDDE